LGAKITMTQIGPVIDTTINHQGKILKAIATQGSSSYPRIGKTQVGKTFQFFLFDGRYFVKSIFRIVKKAFERLTITQYIRYTIAIQIHQFYFRIRKAEAGNIVVAFE